MNNIFSGLHCYIVFHKQDVSGIRVMQG